MVSAPSGDHLAPVIPNRSSFLSGFAGLAQTGLAVGRGPSRGCGVPASVPAPLRTQPRTSCAPSPPAATSMPCASPWSSLLPFCCSALPVVRCCCDRGPARSPSIRRLAGPGLLVAQGEAGIDPGRAAQGRADDEQRDEGGEPG